MATPINIVRDLIVDDITRIPYFINTKSESSKNVWSYLQFILRALSKLTNENVLSDKKVQDYNDQIQECIELILLTLDNDELEIEISYYILSRIERYEAKALELELYEVCANFTKFKKLYQTI